MPADKISKDRMPACWMFIDEMPAEKTSKDRMPADEISKM